MMYDYEENLLAKKIIPKHVLDNVTDGQMDGRCTGETTGQCLGLISEAMLNPHSEVKISGHSYADTCNNRKTISSLLAKMGLSFFSFNTRDMTLTYKPTKFYKKVEVIVECDKHGVVVGEIY